MGLISEERLDELESAKGRKFHHKQREVILSDHRRVVTCWGRKAGKTESIAARCALLLESQDFASPRTDGIAYTSTDLEAGESAVDRAVADLILLGHEFTGHRQMAERNPRLHLAQSGELGFQIRPKQFNRMKAFSLSKGARGLRSYSFFLVVMDEDQLALDRRIDPAVQNTLTAHKGQLIRAGMPMAEAIGGSFWRACHSTRNFVTRVSSEEVSHLDKEVLTAMELAPAEYRMEVLALWPSSSLNAVFSRKKILESQKLFQTERTGFQGTFRTLGVDVASSGSSLNAFASLDFDVRRGLGLVRCRTLPAGTTLDRVLPVIKALDQRSHYNKIVIDDNGLGEGLFYMMRDQFKNPRRIIGVKNHKLVARGDGLGETPQKNALYMNARRLIDQRVVGLEDSKAVLSSLTGMFFAVSKKNDAKTIKGGKDDHIAEAIVRALLPLENMRRIKGMNHVPAPPKKLKTSPEIISENGIPSEFSSGLPSDAARRLRRQRPRRISQEYG